MDGIGWTPKELTDYRGLEKDPSIVCDTGDFRNWIELNFGYFIQQSNFADLSLFNSNLTKVEHLAELSVADLVDFTFLANALQNSTLSALIYSQVTRLMNYPTLLEYLTDIESTICQDTNTLGNTTSCDHQQPMTHLSLSAQRDLLDNIFMVLGNSWLLQVMPEWLNIFNIVINSFPDGLSATYLATLPLNISCGDYQAIIGELSPIYNKLNKTEINTVYTYCKSYLTQQINTTGAPCTTTFNDTVEWIQKNLGAFVTSATIGELLELYPELDLEALLFMLSPMDAALLITKPDVLSNATLLREILSLLWSQKTQYAQAFISSAEMSNLSESQLVKIKQIFLETVFTEHSSTFATYETINWQLLFQDSLILLLPAVTPSILQMIPANISCSSYQAILQAFVMSYGSFTYETLEFVYQNFIKKYLDSQSKLTGVACEAADIRAWIQVNLGIFLKHSSLTDLIQMNSAFGKINDPASLSGSELADFTFLADYFQNDSLTTVLLRRMTELSDCGSLLDYFNRFQKLMCLDMYFNISNPSCIVSDELYERRNQTQERIINETFVLFSKHEGCSDLSAWFQVLITVLNSFDVTPSGAQLSQLPTDLSCQEFQVIVKMLNNVYNRLDNSTRQSFYDYCISYLTQQQKDQGSACSSNVISTEEWITLNLGSFYVFGSVTKLLELYQNLDIAFLLELITRDDVTVLLTKPDVLLRDVLLEKAISLIGKDNITECLGIIETTAKKENISDSRLMSIKETVLTVVFQNLQFSFSTYDDQDWTVLFQESLPDLILYFSKMDLQLLPINMSCSSYQAIVKIFNHFYVSMDPIEQKDIYKYFIKRYLTGQSIYKGIACDTNKLTSWIDVNFGDFIAQSTIQDLTKFNQNFSKIENPESLSVYELVDFTFIAESLQNWTLTTTLVNVIREFKSYETLLKYFLTIQSMTCQLTDASSNISSCGVLQPMSQLSFNTEQKIVTNTFIVLNESWSLENMHQWLEVFHVIIVDFFSALKETHFSQLPLFIPCGEYQTIVNELSSVYYKLDEAEISSIYTYCISYLSGQQQSAGSACEGIFMDTKTWLDENLGPFVNHATYSQLTKLYPNLDVSVLLKILSPDDAALLLTKPDVLSNSNLLTIILGLIQPENITNYTTAITKAAVQAAMLEVVSDPGCFVSDHSKDVIRHIGKLQPLSPAGS
ncbi:uncharacterized protein [Hyperolius riggenbachi]|uniref:uncharacterized protein n=1 Tax=Hyperolius riggenbachi TaxID=752182 RepID=UPI0035A34C5B